MATLNAFLAHSWLKPQDLAAMDKDKLVSDLSYSSSDMKYVDGWILVGTADVTITLNSHDEIAENQVNALRLRKEHLLAETHGKVTLIDAEINSILAIGMSEAS